MQRDWPVSLWFLRVWIGTRDFDLTHCHNFQQDPDIIEVTSWKDETKQMYFNSIPQDPLGNNGQSCSRPDIMDRWPWCVQNGILGTRNPTCGGGLFKHSRFLHQFGKVVLNDELVIFGDPQGNSMNAWPWDALPIIAILLCKSSWVMFFLESYQQGVRSQLPTPSSELTRWEDDLLEDAAELLMKQMQRFFSSRFAVATSSLALAGIVSWLVEAFSGSCMLATTTPHTTKGRKEGRREDGKNRG